MSVYVCVSLAFQLFICALHVSLSSFFLQLSVTLNIVNVLIFFIYNHSLLIYIKMIQKTHC